MSDLPVIALHKKNGIPFDRLITGEDIIFFPIKTAIQEKYAKIPPSHKVNIIRS